MARRTALLTAGMAAARALSRCLRSPMRDALWARRGRWVYLALRRPAGCECTGRLVSADRRGFVLETLDARQIFYQVPPRDVLWLVELPGQDDLQAKWAEYQQAAAALAVRH